MGQRLAIKVSTDNSDLFAIYYHWSAYTKDAAHELKKLAPILGDMARKIKNPEYPGINYQVIESQLNNIGVTIDYLDLTKFGMWDTIKKDGKEYYHHSEGLYPDRLKGNRNDGLVTFTESGIGDTCDYSEYFIYVNVERCMVDFAVYYEYSHDYLSDIEDEEDYQKEKEIVEKAKENPCKDPYLLISNSADFEEDIVAMCNKIINTPECIYIKDEDVCLWQIR